VELLDELTRSRAARERDLAPYATLTAREADTLRALARGWSVADIAANWVVSENTVRSHVRGVLAKLGAPSQLAAVADAVRTGWFVG
jgi:DNA-binding NarL/FixJ family response regulator